MEVAFVIDTNAYSAFFRGSTGARELLEKADRLIIPATVAGELFTGFDRGKRREMNYAEFDHFVNLPGVRIQDVGVNEARHYANLVNNLKTLGKPIPTNDVWIAATALSLGATLLTADRHFSDIAGLRVQDYS